MYKNEGFFLKKKKIVIVRASFMNNRIFDAKTLQTNTPGKSINPR